MTSAPPSVTNIACRAAPMARSSPENIMPGPISTFEGRAIQRKRSATRSVSPSAPIARSSGSDRGSSTATRRAEAASPSRVEEVAIRCAPARSPEPIARLTRAPAAIIRPILMAMAKNWTMAAKPTAAVRFGSPSFDT